MSLIKNSPVGGRHWFRTLVSQIKNNSWGIINSDTDNDTKLEWADRIYNLSNELIENEELLIFDIEKENTNNLKNAAISAYFLSELASLKLDKDKEIEYLKLATQLDPTNKLYLDKIENL